MSADSMAISNQRLSLSYWWLSFMPWLWSLRKLRSFWNGVRWVSFSLDYLTILTVYTTWLVHIFVPYRCRNSFFWGSIILLVLNFLLYSGGIIAEAIACRPLSATWESWFVGECRDTAKFHIVVAYFNLVMDLVILILPQNIIWKLHTTRNRRLGISVIFSFGLL